MLLVLLVLLRLLLLLLLLLLLPLHAVRTTPVCPSFWKLPRVIPAEKNDSTYVRSALFESEKRQSYGSGRPRGITPQSVCRPA